MAKCRLATFETDVGPRSGIVVGNLMYDAAALTGAPGHATVLGLLNAWPEVRTRLASLSADDLAAHQGHALEGVTLRAPVLWPSTIYCAGANYRDHKAEMLGRSGRPAEPDPKANGGSPWFFLKAARAIADPGATVRAASRTSKLDWEAELAVVIGVTTKQVSPEEALTCVAGYTIANDLSARDLSKRADVSESSSMRADWTSHKSFDGSCPLGPWIVPAAEISDPQDLDVRLSVNGIVKQDSNTKHMIFSVAEQISHLSRGMTLHPGDIILTGTPAGVGAARNEFLKPGDRISIEIEHLGRLDTQIG